MEAKIGADWEWHIVGRMRTLKMRVQAKRIQRNGILKVNHKVRSSGKQQRSLLISEAQTARMKAVYCIYCTESQRHFWRETRALPGYRSFQTGCLLADALHVLPTTKRLEQIEDKCRPWHHLFAPDVLMQEAWLYHTEEVKDYLQIFSVTRLRNSQIEVGKAPEPSGDSGWRMPTVDDLNLPKRKDFDWTGVGETTDEDRARIAPDTEAESWAVPFDEERLQDLGVRLMLVMDVTGDTEFDERHMWRMR